MKAVLANLFIVLPILSFTQQLSFSDIIMIGTDHNKFEKKMYELGNDVIRYQTSDSTYGYQTFSGGFGAVGRIPTRLKKLEEKYSLFDSLIITKTELETNYTVDQRNELFKSGSLKETQGPHNNYHYVPDLKGYTVSVFRKATFAENYNKETQKSKTWYYLEASVLGRAVNSKHSKYFTLTVRYADIDDYKLMIQSIQKIAKYIETRSYDDEITIYYQFNDIKQNMVLKISCTSEQDSSGGSINFWWESK